MDDLISRQAAIDALWKALYEYEDKTEKQFQESEDLDVGDWIEHRIFVQNMSDIDRQTILNLPSAQPEQRWISVSERLPERGKDVLVTRDYDGREDFNKSCRYVEIASRYGEDDDPDWKSFSDEYKMHPKNHHVIAWRELPEPYRKERTEE